MVATNKTPFLTLFDKKMLVNNKIRIKNPLLSSPEESVEAIHALLPRYFGRALPGGTL